MVKNIEEVFRQVLELLSDLKNKVYPTENLNKTLNRFVEKLVDHKANWCENCNEYNCKNRQSISKEDNPIEKEEGISENKTAIEYFKIRLESLEEELEELEGLAYRLTYEQKKAFSSALAALERIEREDALYDRFVEFLKDTRGINNVRND